MTAPVKKRGRGFGFTPLSGGLKALTSSNAKQAAPPTQAPEFQQANSEERPKATALQRSPSKEARPRDELSGKLMLEVVDGTKLPLSAKSNPYILCNFDADFSSTGSPSSYAPGTSFADFSNPIWSHSVEFDVSVEDAEKEGRFDFTLYDSVSPKNGSRKETDYLIGSAQLCLTPTQLKEAKNQVHHLKLYTSNDKAAASSGSIQVIVTFKPTQTYIRLTPDDFDVVKKLGAGSFGTVYKVRKRDTGRYYAMKCISKATVAKEKHAGHIISEKNILQLTRLKESPFLVGLKFSFQTETHLYFVMDLKSGGELFAHLQKDGGRWEESRVAFYSAEILIAIETLHSRDIIYRDLKPENVLLDAAGHISLCDFGLSKELRKGKKTQTFCGTSDYLSPEVIQGDLGYDGLIDYWALGILIYEMLTGYTPFFSEDHMDKYKLIVSATLKFPRRGVSENAKDLLTKLLRPQPSTRLGAGGVHEIQEHPFFKDIDWHALEKRRVTPPFKPSTSSSSPERSPIKVDLELPGTPDLSDDKSSNSSPRGSENGSKYNRHRRTSCEVREYQDEEKEHDWYRDFTFSANDSGRNSFSSHHRKSSASMHHADALASFGMSPMNNSLPKLPDGDKIQS